MGMVIFIHDFDSARHPQHFRRNRRFEFDLVYEKGELT